MTLEADLAALEKAINTGAKRVKYQDREVTYASTQELYRIRDDIKRQLGTLNSSSPNRAQGVYDSGL